jgi:hypothetical protein
MATLAGEYLWGEIRTMGDFASDDKIIRKTIISVLVIIYGKLLSEFGENQVS